MGQRLSQPHRRPSTESKAVAPLPKSDVTVPEGFKWVDGRGFKVGGNPTYPLPNDLYETNRLNLQHYLIRLVFSGYFMSPVKEHLERGIKVLDVGCGTGIWSVECAAQYPASDFIGTDIVDAFSRTAPSAPANCRFELADTLKGLPFPDGSFDFVFQRMQLSSFREDEWPTVITELVRVVCPGGWIELVDMDGWLYGAGPKTTEFCTKLRTVLKMRGIVPSIVREVGGMLEATGIEDVVHDHRSIPVGWGPAEVAVPSTKNLVAFFESMKPTMLLVLGIPELEYDTLIGEASEELNTYQTYWNIDYAFGRKPLSTE